MEKELIEKQSEQVLYCIDRFLSLPFSEKNYKMKLGSIGNIECNYCVLMINFKGQLINVNFPINMNFKTSLYEQVLWKIFDKFSFSSDFSLEKQKETKKETGTSWFIIIKNKDNQNNIIFEFAIQDHKDFMWIEEAFKKWDEKLIVKSKKIEKK